MNLLMKERVMELRNQHLKSILILLGLILLLQVALFALYAISRFDPPSEEKIKTPESQIIKIQKPSSTWNQFDVDQSAEDIVNSLKKSFSEMVNDEIQLSLGKVQLISASSASHIVLMASGYYQGDSQLKEIECWVQLSSEGELVYQSRGRQEFSTENTAPSTQNFELEFVIDHPPDFDSAQLKLDWVKFKKPGFTQ